MNYRGLINKYSTVIVLLLLVIFFTFATGLRFIQPDNLLAILRQSSTIGIIAFGVTIIIITRGIDLSSGSLVALISVVVASLLQTQKGSGIFIKYEALPQLPIILPVLIGLIVGVIVGFINGFMVVKAKIPAFIITLGMMTIARGIAFLYADGRPLSGLNEDFNTIFGQGFFLFIPNPVWVFLLCAIISHIFLSYTRFGSYVYAIGANQRAAHVTGIPIGFYLLLVYIYAGLLVGISSLALTARIGSGQAGLGQNYELFAIASAVIGGASFSGGKGTIIGTVIGTLIIGVIKNGMDVLNVSAYLQQIILGIIIVLAVVLDQIKNNKAR